MRRGSNMMITMHFLEKQKLYFLPPSHLLFVTNVSLKCVHPGPCSTIALFSDNSLMWRKVRFWHFIYNLVQAKRLPKQPGTFSACTVTTLLLNGELKRGLPSLKWSYFKNDLLSWICRRSGQPSEFDDNDLKILLKKIQTQTIQDLVEKMTALTRPSLHERSEFSRKLTKHLNMLSDIKRPQQSIFPQNCYRRWKVVSAHRPEVDIEMTGSRKEVKALRLTRCLPQRGYVLHLVRLRRPDPLGIASCGPESWLAHLCDPVSSN